MLLLRYAKNFKYKKFNSTITKNFPKNVVRFNNNTFPHQLWQNFEKNTKRRGNKKPSNKIITKLIKKCLTIEKPKISINTKFVKPLAYPAFYFVCESGREVFKCLKDRDLREFLPDSIKKTRIGSFAFKINMAMSIFLTISKNRNATGLKAALKGAQNKQYQLYFNRNQKYIYR